MALRARLAPPQPAPTEGFRYHEAEWASLPSQIVAEGDRRFEAETYLASGFGIRRAIEARPAGWVRLLEPASVWQPSRLKGILVSPEFGTPFLAATQVFDLRPIPRKWLASSKIKNA